MQWGLIREEKKPAFDLPGATERSIRHYVSNLLIRARISGILVMTRGRKLMRAALVLKVTPSVPTRSGEHSGCQVLSSDLTVRHPSNNCHAPGSLRVQGDF